MPKFNWRALVWGLLIAPLVIICTPNLLAYLIGRVSEKLDVLADKILECPLREKYIEWVEKKSGFKLDE